MGARRGPPPLVSLWQKSVGPPCHCALAKYYCKSDHDCRNLQPREHEGLRLRRRRCDRRSKRTVVFKKILIDGIVVLCDCFAGRLWKTVPGESFVDAFLQCTERGWCV